MWYTEAMAESALTHPADLELVPNQLASSPDQAVNFLARSANALRALGRANVFCRIMLGRQLLAMQERQLWLEIPDPGQPQNRLRFRSWGDFMVHGFPLITGFSCEIGYAAIRLADSEVLRRLPEEELRKFENLANASHLVKLQRQGLRVTDQLISAAQTLPVKEFRLMTGYGKKATVEAVMESREAALELQPILAILKAADLEAIAALRQVFERAMVQAGGSPTDAVDCVIAACREQWRQEEEPADEFEPIVERA